MKKIIISEYKLSDEDIINYKKKGYDFYYGYEQPYIPNQCSVGILLDTLYKSTMDLINRLLYFKHPVTLKYKDKIYKLHTLEEWNITVQSDKDQIKTMTIKHPILQIYEEQRREYYEKRRAKKRAEQYELAISTLDKVPLGEDLDTFLEKYARLYSISIDYSDEIHKLQMYNQIKFYLDNELPFDREIDAELFGDEIYLDDIYCKEGVKIC